jgi:LysR family glycine cleavage system transcriptional activator
MLPLVRLPSLDLIRGFVAVARRMSVTQAADDLCLTQSAVSKQIRALEDSLGVPLFHRGFRSLQLTEHGQLLFRAADSSLLQLQEILALFAPHRKKPVTITASTGVAGLWLLPRLGEFRQQYPHTDVRLVASNTILELGADVDLSVRYCSERQAPLGAVKLFAETIAPIASPSLGMDALATVEQLETSTLLEFDVPGRPWLHWSDWLAARGWTTSNARGVLLYNQYDQMVQAAVAGQGIGLGRLELLDDMLTDARLKVLAMGERSIVDSDYSYWLIQADKSPGEDVRNVIEWVLAMARRVPVHGSGPAEP